MSFLYQDIARPGGVVISPSSDEGMELARWNRPKSQGGMNRDGHEEYPKALVRGMRTDKGKFVLSDQSRRVHNESEERIAIGQGWFVNGDDAIAAMRAEHTEHGKLEAERAYQTMRMSDLAQRDAAAREPETIAHVPDLPAVPVKPRGRPRKTTEVA